MTEQRFNVAMSRARDRVYLVRSVTSSMLNPKDLKAAVLLHFRNPMGDAIIPQSTDVLALCDSPFEREVGARLLKLGYRLRPQVPVGGYRIDFVIESSGDRRLAIELDGDSYHGPDRWVSDLYRQRALERMGWKFWRCWGSHWRADAEGCFDDLLATLSQMGIEPVGGDYSPFVYTEHRVVDTDIADGVTDLDTGDQQSGIPVEGEAPNSSPKVDSAESETGPPRVAVDLFTPTNVAPVTAAPIAVIESASEFVVEVGDTVIVRFDDNRIRRFRLSADTHRPEDGVVHINQAIGLALLGNGLEEEVEFVVDGKLRTVVIEKISKATQLELTD